MLIVSSLVSAWKFFTVYPMLPQCHRMIGHDNKLARSNLQATAAANQFIDLLLTAVKVIEALTGG